MSILFDITNEESALDFLNEYTGIDKIDILKSIIKSKASDSNGYIIEFIENFNINIEKLNIHDIKCAILHMTTNNDECESIKKYGLVDLQKALTLETPLNSYLKKHGVKFDINKKLMHLNSMIIDIEYKAEAIPLTKTDEKIKDISRKIYFDNQINGFFSLNDWDNYGGYVNKRPEILYNIGDIMGDKIELNWIKSNECYEIKFKASIKDIEYFTFYDTKEDCDQDYIYNYYNLKKWFLEKSVYVMWCKYKTAYRQLPDICAYMKPTAIISREDIIDVN